MEYDDPDSGVSLDRNAYSENTNVEIILDDIALNVDPTSGDVWTFDATDGTATYEGDGV